MHGIVFAEFRKFAEEKLGSDAWNTLRTNAGLARKMYVPVQEYPDSEIAALVGAASKLTGRPAFDLVQDFGEFITPALMGMYFHLIKPSWRALDVIEYTEGTIHTVVRVNSPGARPPKLKTTRLGVNEVLLVYDSPRRMCALAIGIGYGLGTYYKEKIVAQQTQCMHQGARSCQIVFRKTG